MTGPTAQELRDHLLPLLADAGWTRRGRHAFRRADRILSVDRNRIFLTEVDLPEGPIIVLEAHVTSVEQAVAYLRIAGVLPAEESPKPDLATCSLSELVVYIVRQHPTWNALQQVKAVRDHFTSNPPGLRELVQLVKAAREKAGFPAVADSGWRAEPPCILCGQPAARGLRHCPSCQDILGQTAPVVTS